MLCLPPLPASLVSRWPPPWLEPVHTPSLQDHALPVPEKANQNLRHLADAADAVDAGEPRHSRPTFACQSGKTTLCTSLLLDHFMCYGKQVYYDDLYQKYQDLLQRLGSESATKFWTHPCKQRAACLAQSSSATAAAVASRGSRRNSIVADAL